MVAQSGKMRSLAFASVLLSSVALVLSFLCIFAGSSKGFMEDYAIITLNTSRIAEGSVNTLSQKLCSGNLRKRQNADLQATITDVDASMVTATATPVKPRDPGFLNSIESGAASLASKATSAVHSEATAIEGELKHLCDELGNEVGDKVEAFLQDVGLHDFYSAHVLDFCEGYFIPGPVPNATIPAGTISKNVTECSNKTALYSFQPTTTLAEQLKNKTGGEIDLTDFHWPSKISHGLNALRVAQKAVFIFYCIAIGCIFLAMLLAVAGLFFNGRLSALGNVLINGLAFLTIMIASAIVTVIAVTAAHLINKYGNDIGVSATKGNNFLALTWTSTALVFLSGCVWCYEFFARWKRERSIKVVKYG